jgi:hypothetical protein
VTEGLSSASGPAGRKAGCRVVPPSALCPIIASPQNWLTVQRSVAPGNLQSPRLLTATSSGWRSPSSRSGCSSASSTGPGWTRRFGFQGFPLRTVEDIQAVKRVCAYVFIDTEKSVGSIGRRRTSLEPIKPGVLAATTPAEPPRWARRWLRTALPGAGPRDVVRPPWPSSRWRSPTGPTTKRANWPAL